MHGGANEIPAVPNAFVLNNNTLLGAYVVGFLQLVENVIDIHNSHRNSYLLYTLIVLDISTTLHY